MNRQLIIKLIVCAILCATNPFILRAQNAPAAPPATRQGGFGGFGRGPTAPPGPPAPVPPEVMMPRPTQAEVDKINADLRDFISRAADKELLNKYASLLTAMSISLLASRGVSKPLEQLIARLKTSEAAGRLRPDFPENSPTREVNQLAASFNRAARAVELSSQKLENAYLEFVETMAQALDARDPYTAGHSDRVSDYSVAIAAALALPPGEIETIRIGARLHDIGKIGIPDAVLQKSGYLTPEEYALVKLHPQIGKRILERVGRFDKYLPIVELHHEDHDGRGYPYGLKGHEVPLAVRIVHVADVYDALTTDRAYRAAMSHARAVEILEQCSGSSFDPEVVRAFLTILAAQPAAEPLAQDLALLGRLG